MGRKQIAAALIGAAAGLVTPPALAEETPIPAYARTASSIATAIHAGEDVSARADMLALPAAEYAELGRLKGCNGEVQPAARPLAVLINWTCGDGTPVPGLQRSMLMIFEEGGRLVRFGINAPLGALAPTPAALAAGKLPFPRRFGAMLGEAIISGDDPGLGGLVALSAFDRARLAPFKGGKFWVLQPLVRSTMPGIADVKRIRLRDATARYRQTLHVYFDAQDRPLGLAFAPVTDPEWEDAAPLIASTAIHGDGRITPEAEMEYWATILTR